MFRTHKVLLILMAGCCSLLYAAQSTPYILTDFPLVAMASGEVISIKWTGVNRDPLAVVPDSGRIYFSRSPGGSLIRNYTDSVKVYYQDSITQIVQNNIQYPGALPQRGIKFKPSAQTTMGPGVYYFIVGWRTKIGLIPTEFFSNEMMMIVESDKATEPISPAKGVEIDNLTPTFTWKANPGVPYYHVLVSNKEISASTTGDSIDVTGLSIVWQAITPKTQITYGAPDPSGTITADPPPMSPGQTYSWIVLNNYGNNIVYTSKRFGLPEAFKIKGLPLKAPQPVWPLQRDTIDGSKDSIITFKWTNLDPAANTYQVYTYVTAEYQGQNAQMLVWKGEVAASGFNKDTGSLSINVRSILTNNIYTWNVMAVDDRGGGTGGPESKFVYEGIAMGTLKVHTKETITIGANTIEKPVTVVQIQSEVLEGSMEAPLLYYTDNDGVLARDRPAGRYRLTAVKNGFESATRTVTVVKDGTVDVTIYLKRPDATIFGKVFDKTGNGINLARIYGVSDQGDTVKAESDAIGNYVLSCIEADWKIWFQKDGFITSAPRDTAVTFGQSVNFGTIILEKNPNVLSGMVKNSKGNTLQGVKVTLKQGSTVVGILPSTPQDGAFSFTIQSGTYSLNVEKTGFVSQDKTIEVVSSKQVVVEMPAGAAVISGSIYGGSWGTTGKIFAPIPSASIILIDSSVTPPKVFTTTSNGVYGNYNSSVEANKTYTMQSSAQGYVPHTRLQKVSTEGGLPQTVLDTLMRFANMQGKTADTNGSAAISDVSVMLVDTLSKTTFATVKSDIAGLWEMQAIPNGVYRMQAGKVGFVTRTIVLIDTGNVPISTDVIRVLDGRVVNTDVGIRVIKTVSVRLEAGSKSIGWRAFCDAAYLTDFAVKIASPLQKTLRGSDTLKSVGAGTYVVALDGDADSIIDVSRHQTVVPAGASEAVIDTVKFVAAHTPVDSLSVESGKVTLVLRAFGSALDSGRVLYKDAGDNTFDSLNLPTPTDYHDVIKIYTFQFPPKKDGSRMEYFFRLFKGADVFGYNQELYSAYVKPDLQTLTKLAVTPSSDDTLLLAANVDVAFNFRAYSSSRFMLDSLLKGQYVHWSIVNDSKSTLSAKTGTLVKLHTPAGGIDGVGRLVIKLDTVERRIASTIADSVVVAYRVSSKSLDSIIVRRSDDAAQSYITTDILDKAEFVAEGVDTAGSLVTVTPQWTVAPENAGRIVDGVFRPADNFAGWVRIGADAGGIHGEFNMQTSENINNSGFEIRYRVPSRKDTLTNYLGCSVIFPDSCFDPAAQVEVELAIPVLENRVELNTGKYAVIGNVFDIGAASRIVTDLAFRGNPVIALDVPEAYRKQAGEGIGEFKVGYWNEDSLSWILLDGSELDTDRKIVSAEVRHFSRYGILLKKAEGSPEFEIKPNPFSPYVRAKQEFGSSYPGGVPLGTCITITPKAASNVRIKLDIYTVVGDQVLTADLKSVPSNVTYHVWWDGKTNGISGARLLNGPVNSNTLVSYLLSGDKLCRNGRYYVVLTISEGNKNKQYMKPLVMLK
jgi:hypothetical protein